MNWFFHRIYWTGWISSHHRRRPSLLGDDPEANLRRVLLGFAILGFTSVYRECFEIVVFLQNLRQLHGSSVVLEGVVIGGLFTGAAGVLTFALHQRLPCRRLLVITAVMLLFVLVVSVSEEVNEMQLAGWIGTTVSGVNFPGRLGTWFSLLGNWEPLAAEAGAVLIVLGSHAGAQYLRVWRPRGVVSRRHASRAPRRRAGRSRRGGRRARRRLNRALSPGSVPRP